MKLFKLFIATIGMVGSIGILNAQVVPEKKFTVSYSNEAYMPLDASRAIEIYGPTSGESFDIETPINTNILFDFCGTEMTTFHITESGGITVNSSMVGEEEGYFIGNIMGFLVGEMEPISENARLLMDTMTVAGHKVLVYEIRDFSAIEDTFLFNYQIWLHEGSNVIDIRMGNHNFPAGSFSNIEIDEFDSFSYIENPLYAGLIYNNGDTISDNPDDWNIHFVSPLHKDTLININSFDEEEDAAYEVTMADYLWTTFPESGTIIRFTPIIAEDSSASIPLFTKLKASIYPNPSESGIFTVQLGEDAKNTAIVLMDIKGRVLLNGQKNSRAFDIDLSNYANGTYFLQMNNGAQKVTMKLVKK